MGAGGLWNWLWRCRRTLAPHEPFPKPYKCVVPHRRDAKAIAVMPVLGVRWLVTPWKSRSAISARSPGLMR